MLKKQQRISRKDLAVNKFPFSFYPSRYFSVKIRKNTLDYFRFAFIISKKVDKRAVVRNTVKRRFGTAVASYTPSKGYDIVFLPKKESIQLSPFELEQTIKQVLEKHTS